MGKSVPRIGRGSGGGIWSLGTPTGITAKSERDNALQVVDSEGEILFFDRSKVAKINGKGG